MSKKFIRIISIVLCVITIISMFSIVPVSAATQQTTTGQWVYTNIDDSKSHGLSGYISGTFTYEYKINGYSGFCLTPHKSSPSGNMWSRYAVVDKEKYKNLLKALYCYKNGDLTADEIKKAVTSQGISYKSSDEFTIMHYLFSWLYGEDKNWNSQFKGTGIETAIRNLWTTISNKKVTIPDSFNCYTVSPQDNKYQTLLILPNNKLTISKTDSISGDKLSGAKFHIYYTPDDKNSYKGSEVGRGTWTTGNNGTVTIWLPPGRYKIVEEKAPTGYQKSSEEKYITLSGSAGQQTNSVTIKNSPLIKLELTKQSSTSKEYSLEGAKYGVYTDSACKNLFGNIITDSNGYGCLKDSKGNVKYVAKKDYWVKELTAPNGYSLDSKIYKFVDSGLKTNGFARYVPNNTVNGSKGKVTDDPQIKLQLIKRSANCDLTDDNNLYSLEGAEYSIYTDRACTQYFGFIRTDKDGYGRYGSSSETNSDNADKTNVSYKKNSGKSVALNGNTTYYCKETKVPKGYELDETVYQFKNCGSVTSSKLKIYRAYSLEDNSEPIDTPINDPVGIVLQKKNAVTGETINQGLEGAVFKIQYYAQEIDKDYNVDTSTNAVAPALDEANLKRTWYVRTNDKGRALLADSYLADNYKSDEFYFGENGMIATFPIGTVVIKEVEAPEGYTISDFSFYRRINEEIASIAQDTNTPIEVPIDEQPAVGYIGIHKMNNSRQGVANAVYGLYATEKADNTPLSTLTTDKDGNGLFNYSAPIGTTLYIKEIEAPTGYFLDSTIYPIAATVENLTVETAVIQEIFEDSIKGDISIQKSSEDGIVKNLWFAVVDDLGNEYNPVVTNEKGTAEIKGLPVYKPDGSKINYNIKELGFKVEKTTLSYGGYTWEIDLNKCIKYKNVYYEGVANNVYTSSNSKIPAYSRYYYGDVATAIKNQNGIKQTLSNNETVTYSFENRIKYAELEVQKQAFDNDLYRLFFSVSDQFGNKYNDLVTNANGYASTKDWSNKPKAAIAISNSSVFIPINYKITELGFENPGSSSYYIPDKYKEAFKSAYQSCNANTGKYTLTFNAYNEADTGQINIKKSSEDGEIENLWFEISAWDDEREYGGEMYETYLGYDENGNKLHRILIKTDKDGNATSDSVQIYDRNGLKMDGLFVYLETENDFEITYKVKELGYANGDGTYTLPDRYSTTESDYLYLIDNRSVTYNCVNSTKKGKLQIKKTSEDNIVNDIWFNIKSDYIDLDVSTDESGFTEIIDDLDIYKHTIAKRNELVTYTVTELGVKTYDDNGEWTGEYHIPNRYKNPTVRTVTLSDDVTEIKTVSFNNSLVTGNAVLTKKDGLGNNLQGSKWELYRETAEGDGEIVYLAQTGSNKYGIYSGGTVSELSTDKKGELYVYNLPFGSYYFVEKTAPNGYMPYGEKIYFSILASDETVSLTYDFTVKDNKHILPNTGGIGVIPIYILGSAVAAVAVINIIIYFKKRKNERGKENENF